MPAIPACYPPDASVSAQIQCTDRFEQGKPVVSEMDEFPENFRFFFALETALLVMNFRKNFEIGGGETYILKAGFAGFQNPQTN